jgi:hypothetical protein
MDDGTNDGTGGWKASFRPGRPLLYVITSLPFFNDETMPNFIRKKHPRKGEKKKQSAR